MTDFTTMDPCSIALETDKQLMDIHNMSDKDFVDFLFDKMTDLDTDMIDLQDDDSCDDHLQFSKLEE
jgi:hypothetical protein